MASGSPPKNHKHLLRSPGRHGHGAEKPHQFFGHRLSLTFIYGGFPYMSVTFCIDVPWIFYKFSGTFCIDSLHYHLVVQVSKIPVLPNFPRTLPMSPASRSFHVQLDSTRVTHMSHLYFPQFFSLWRLRASQILAAQWQGYRVTTLHMGNGWVAL